MSSDSKRQTPSEARQESPKGETLRELASKKIHGKGANPSQLGDPISLKAESSKTIPTDEEEESKTGDGYSTGKNKGYGSDNGRDKLREAKAKNGPGGRGTNPSMLGDPVSLKAETSDNVPTEGEQGARRESKI